MTPEVYVIYCRELSERRIATQKHLDERGIAAKWWRAPHGNSWQMAAKLEYDAGKVISPGHLSLLLAHWTLWEHLDHVLPHPNSVAMICEDDVVFPPNWADTFLGVERELWDRFRDWQFVFLGLAQTEPNVWTNITERIGGPDSRLCTLNDPFGTHCYLVRKSALTTLLDNFPPAQRNMDQQLWQRVLSKGLLRWCAVLPSLVLQRTHDHQMTGKPEWAPVTIDADEIPRVLGVPILGDDDRPGRPSQKMYEMTMAVVDPFGCIYRGSFLEDPGVDDRGKSVALSACAKLNAPCHSRRGATATLDQTPVRACETCDYRLEMAPTRERDRLPVPDGHFNCSMIVYNGRLILATRDSWGHSRIGLWDLTNAKEDWTGEWSVKPIGSYASDHWAAPRLEDPRLYVAPDPDTGVECLHAMLSLPDGYPPKLVQVGYVRFAPDLSGITRTDVFKSPHGNLYEKNWVPFWWPNSKHGMVRWVYGTKPDHVVLNEICNNEHDKNDVYVTPNPLPWTGGAVRGGAAPVLMTPLIAHALNYPRVFDGAEREVYYHFYHGCLKRMQGSVYTIGCCVFEAKPPFRVLRQTPTPLVWPDLPAAGESCVKRYVVFPGGAVPHAGAWHIAAGVDDTFCRIYRLPFEQVEAALSDVPEAEPTLSIRETPICRGVKS